MLKARELVSAQLVTNIPMSPTLEAGTRAPVTEVKQVLLRFPKH